MVILRSITEFIGHFHPVLVHLPIGILLIAVLFQFLARKEKYESLHTAIGITLFWGMLSAIAACISGFLLSQSGDYEGDLISKHQWLGITTAVVSIAAYYLNKKNNKLIKWAMGAMALLIVITGHLGGSLTHGSDYLTKALGASKEKTTDLPQKQITNIQEAVVYSDLIQPVLQSKCYSCHGANKQKGKLRLDEPDFILKGGKDGKIIVAGNAAESDLINRILLPKDNEDHMPPKEKPPLSKQDIDLIHWWVSGGADFTKKVKEYPQTEKIKTALAAFQTGTPKEKEPTLSIPETPVEKADTTVLRQLKDRGVAISAVAQNNNYLAANFIGVDSVTENDLQLLLRLQKQLVSLKLGNLKITDNNMVTVSKLVALTRLYLERTPITDKGLENLKPLSQLQYINLSGTKITTNGLLQLSGLKKLQQIFLYQTNITGNEWGNIKKVFPNTAIDTGGYSLPFLSSDTAKVKESQVKK
jgi:uncharacterized membrane protein/mono/diheme cytochrome c family protein